MNKKTKQAMMTLRHMVDETRKVMYNLETNFSDTTVMQMCLDVEKQAYEVVESAYGDWSDGQ